MPPVVFPSCSEKLMALETELADFAFVLDRRGRADAADVAISIAARVAEIRAEIETADDVRTEPGRSLKF
ncbi:MAG TPA: hypothetical protein VG710_08840 [Opitutus sp.]|nr:hypothetical protein [Opitutus sp.]